MNTAALDNARQSRTTADVPAEHADFVQALAVHRGFLRVTVAGLTDEQAALTPTVSALCLGGLIKHVTHVEKAWTAFIAGGAEAMYPSEPTAEQAEQWANAFRLVGDETLAGVLDGYDRVAHDTDELIASLPDLDLAHPLPEAPWFEPGASWSARQVLLHIIAETAQHAGHADIIRESIDGAKTMG